MRGSKPYSPEEGKSTLIMQRVQETSVRDSRFARAFTRREQFIALAAQAVFVAMASILAWRVAQGTMRGGHLWWLPIAAFAGVVLADFVSGLVHFLADNFCEPDSPIIGPSFVRPFREHHDDPMSITRHGFLETNNGNTLVTLPVLVPVSLAPLEESATGTMAGALTLAFLVAIWLTNQIHKWAHMPDPPRVVRLLQRSRLILANGHHDVHHTSPFDTYYCITVGLWNPLLERVGFFPWLERAIRRTVPGTNPLTRVQRLHISRSASLGLVGNTGSVG